MTVEEFLGTTDYCFDEVEIYDGSSFKTFWSSTSAIDGFGSCIIREWSPQAGVDGYGDPKVSIEIYID